MSVKNLGLVVVCHQPFIHETLEEEQLPPSQYDILFTAISETYIPLLNLLGKIENQKINAKFSIVLSPTLCAMLSDENTKLQYVSFLDRQIALGESEILRLKDNPSLLNVAKECLEKAKNNKEDFTNKFKSNLIGEFARFSSIGLIEILGTTGTFAFLPHYADMEEILNAQIETGINSHKKYFGIAPDGFYLPYNGYTKGIERVLRSYGISYTILDSRSVLFNEQTPQNGIFYPIRLWNSLSVFIDDSACSLTLNNKENGLFNSKCYKDQNKDIGFELSSQQLKDFFPPETPRSNTLFRYYSKNNDKTEVYNKEIAVVQAKNDAKSFLKMQNEKLEKAEKLIEKSANLFVTIDAKYLGQAFAEGMDFFEEVLTSNTDSTFITPSELLSERFSFERLDARFSSSSGTGYGEDLLDSSNSWMLFYTRKMCERMIELAERFPDDSGLKERLLNLGAKEVLLAQSGEISKMLHSGFMSDFAKESFDSYVLSFTTVFDSLGSNIVSTEWLTKLEKKHDIFPWMNYKIFAKKH